MTNAKRTPRTDAVMGAITIPANPQWHPLQMLSESLECEAAVLRADRDALAEALKDLFPHIYYAYDGVAKIAAINATKALAAHGGKK